MTSYMNIMVRVISNRAQAQMEALRRSQAGLTSEITNTNRLAPMGQRHIQSLSKFGNQLQWTGRMIQYNFTLPILAAGAAAVKWDLDNQKAATHVAKVYGDVKSAAAQYRRESQKLMTQTQAEAKARRVMAGELEALDGAFTAISNHYGVQKKEVLEVAGAWAAAGASGRRLAESVNQTMIAMIIGDMASADATRALISIQAQYNLSSKELMGTLATLNSVENQTGASMSDLITGFEKAAGVARAAGVDVNHLAAFMAALVPATGSAATAGNALKTIFSRLMAPTQEATQVMEAMGLHTTALAWQSSTATERLKIMSKEFEGLGASAKNVASSVIASRWQINKFEVLMNEITSTTGYYAKALDSAEHSGQNFKRMQTELNTVLESDPRKLQRMWVMLQNAMSKIIQPLIPYILYLADSVADLANSFANLNPYVQKLVLLGLVLLALVGPVVKYMGALTTLFAVLGTAVLKGGRFLGIFFRTVEDGEGGLVAARRGILQLIAAFTIKPILQFGSVMMGMLGAVSSGLLRFTAFAATALTGIFTAAAPIIAGSINAIARSILNRGILGAVATMGSSIIGMFTGAMAGSVGIVSGGMSAIFGIMASRFAAIRAAQYVWTATTLLAFRTWVFKLGTIFTLLPAFIMESMSAVWALLMIPGAISGAIAGRWATLTLKLGAIWTAFSGFISGLWARTVTFLTVGAYAGRLRGAWVATTVFMSATWSAMCLRMSKLWTATLVFMMSPSKILALFTGMAGGARTGALKLSRAIFSPIGLAIAAVVGVLYVFRDQIKQIWNNLMGYFGGSGADFGNVWVSIIDRVKQAFYSLPQSVQDVMVAVAQIVHDAAIAVYNWFQYINPWASHSPSLVDSVTTGMTEVTRQFGRLSSLKGILGAAYAEIKRFGNLTAHLGVSAAAAQQAEDRKTLKKAGAGQALGSYNKLIGILNRLTPILKNLEARMNAQQRVVDQWQSKVDKANRRLEVQQGILSDLQDVLDKYSDKLHDAQDQLQYYASAPLKGMHEMEQQIFRNQVAQTKLRWEMMKFEDVNGTFDELRAKIDGINAATELLRGKQTELRAAGAGSEILGQYDKELKKLDQQKDKYAEAADKLAEMQSRLDALQRAADRLDLIKAMKFDELQYRIDMAANQMKELSFDEIMAGIQGAQQNIALYSDKVDKATQAVDKQKAVVDRLTAARDRLQARLDKETATLDRIKNKYDKVNDAISAIKDSISDVISSADKMNQKLEAKKSAKGGSKAAGYVSPGLQNFLNAGKADFPDVGGAGIPPRKDWSSQVKGIDKFTDQLAQDTASMFEQLNPFAPLKDKAVAAWNWIKDKAKNIGHQIADVWKNAMEGVDWGGGGAGDALKIFQTIGHGATEFIKDIMKWVKALWDLFAPSFMKIFKAIWGGLKDIWKSIGPELAQFGDVLKKLPDALHNLWAAAKPVIAILSLGFLAVAKIGLEVIAGVIRPLLWTIGKVLAGVIRVIRGFIEIIVGIFTGDWKMVWKGVVDIVWGTIKTLGQVLWGGLKMIWGIVSGIFHGIVDFAKWLWDQLVGHSIIPDIIRGIISWFSKLWGLAKDIWSNVLKPIIGVFTDALGFIVDVLKLWWAGVKTAWNMLKTAATWIWDHVLEPVYDKVKSLWDKYVKPALKLWWTGVKAVWNTLKKVPDWIWDNVLKPAWDKVKDLWTKTKSELQAWWERIKSAWNKLLALGNWVWQNVISPIWTRIKEFWTVRVKGELEAWRGRIERAWGALTRLAGWIKDNVMDPVFEAFKTGWGKIKEWFRDSIDILVSPVKAVVRGIVSAINWIIKGINKLDSLPGVDFQIGLITLPDEFKKGGIPKRKVGGGWKTNGARAIVGEGKRGYPEFVIPTDPMHRKRATALLTAAASKIGARRGQPLGDQPGDVAKVLKSNPTNGLFGWGGWLGDHAMDSLHASMKFGGKVAGKVAGMGIKTFQNTMEPYFGLARHVANGIDWGPGRQTALGGIDLAAAWFGLANQVFKSEWEENRNKYVGGGGKGVRNALKWAKAQVGTPYLMGGVSPEGVDCSGFMSAITNVIRGKAPWNRVGTTASFPWPGFNPMGPYVPQGFIIGSNNQYPGSNFGHMAGTLANVNVESAGGVGVRVGSSARGYYDAGFDTKAQLTGLKYGGIVRHRVGGMLAKIGEGAHDEVVEPLPHNWRSNRGGGETNLHFHGDLVFPNVTNGDDAEAFIDNLVILAKD